MGMPLRREALRVYEESYSDVIRRELAEHGPRPMAHLLFTGDEMRALLKSGRLTRLPDSRAQFGSVVMSRVGQVWSVERTRMVGGPKGVLGATVAEKGNVLLLAGVEGVKTFDLQGQLLQTFDYPQLGMAADEVVAGTPKN